MKKFLSNFADSLISRDQMKSVKGGCGSGYACTIRCYNAAEELLGTLDGGGDCVGGKACCEATYTTTNSATCNCN